jgi:hypothetical protein
MAARAAAEANYEKLPTLHESLSGTLLGIQSCLREALIKSILPTDIPSRAEAHVEFAAFAARLKPCPDISCLSRRVFDQAVDPCPFKTTAFSEVPKSEIPALQNQETH